MTPAELKTYREALGLPVAWLAEQAGVAERTVRYWESGRNRVPDDVAEIIQRAEAATRRLVAAWLAQVVELHRETADALGGEPEGVDLLRYSTDAALWRAHPDLRPLPATCHAAALARLAREMEARGIQAVIEWAG